jgi:hypothetical protein
MLTYFLPHTRCYYDASVSLGLDAKEFDARLAAIESKVGQASKSMSKSFGGVSLGGLGGALGGFLSVSAVAAAGKAVIDYVARVQDLSDRFGVSTDAIQHFGNAAEKNGSSLEAMTMGFNKLEIARSKALKGDHELIGSFHELGISINDLQKLKPEELVTKIGASSMKAADMVKVFGKSALELRPTLAGIADGTIKMGDAIDGINIKRLKEAQDEWKKLFEVLTIKGGTAIGFLVGELNKASAQFEGLANILYGVNEKAFAPRHHGAGSDWGSESHEDLAGQKPKRDFSEESGSGADLTLGKSGESMEETLGKIVQDKDTEAHKKKLEQAKEKEARFQSGLASLSEMAGPSPYGEAGSAKEFDAASKSRWDAGFAAQDASSFGKGVTDMKRDGEGELKKALSAAEQKLDKIAENTGKPFVNH